MVQIECPHCEEEIELDDDAVGEFSCPYCDGEFEWGESDDNDSILDELGSIDLGPVGKSSKKKKVRSSKPIAYDGMLSHPAWRISVGSVFATLMAWFAISIGIMGIWAGLFLSDLGAGGAGAFMILIGFGGMAFFGFGTAVGVLVALGRFWALIVSFVFSCISAALTIIGWLVEEDSCEEVDFWTGECLKTVSEPFPVFGLILWLTMAGIIGLLLFHPVARYQFD